MNVLLLGATGHVGSEVLKLLIDDDSVKRIVLLSRKEIKRNSPKAEQHLINFDEIKKTDFVFNNVDAVICALGTTIKKGKTEEAFRKVDFEYPVTAAETAKKKGVRRYILVSSVGADSKSKNFYLRTKGETEEAVRQIGFDSLVILRPSLLLGERNEKRVGEQLAQKILPKISFLIPGKYVPVHAKDVAKKIVEELHSENESVKIISSEEIS